VCVRVRVRVCVCVRVRVAVGSDADDSHGRCVRGRLLGALGRGVFVVVVV
jgi:hypothetical protein